MSFLFILKKSKVRPCPPGAVATIECEGCDSHYNLHHHQVSVGQGIHKFRSFIYANRYKFNKPQLRAFEGGFPASHIWGEFINMNWRNSPEIRLSVIVIAVVVGLLSLVGAIGFRTNLLNKHEKNTGKGPRCRNWRKTNILRSGNLT